MLKVYTNVIILRVFWDLLSSFSITSHQYYCVGFPGGTRGKDPTCQCRRHKRCRFNPWARKIPWRRAWQCSCLRNIMDTGGCGAVQRVTETQTRVKGPSTHARTLLCVAVIQMLLFELQLFHTLINIWSSSCWRNPSLYQGHKNILLLCLWKVYGLVFHM